MKTLFFGEEGGGGRAGARGGVRTPLQNDNFFMAFSRAASF
jgi:hypothetical protein